MKTAPLGQGLVRLGIKGEYKWARGGRWWPADGPLGSTPTHTMANMPSYPTLYHGKYDAEASWVDRVRGHHPGCTGGNAGNQFDFPGNTGFWGLV